jgi:hypothetical protein
LLGGCGLSARGAAVATVGSDCRRLGKRRWGRGGERTPWVAVSMMRSTTIPGRMARPVELCTRSVLNTTGLGCGAGVDALCTIPVTLSTPSRHKVATKTCTSTKTPPAPSPTLLPCCLLPSRSLATLGTRSARNPDWRAAPANGAGEGGGNGRDRGPSMVHSTTTLRRMARRVGLCTRSVLNTAGLASGAGVDALCTIPVTLSTPSRHKVATKTSTNPTHSRHQPPHPATSPPHLPPRAPQNSPGAGSLVGRSESEFMASARIPGRWAQSWEAGAWQPQARTTPPAPSPTPPPCCLLPSRPLATLPRAGSR